MSLLVGFSALFVLPFSKRLASRVGVDFGRAIISKWRTIQIPTLEAGEIMHEQCGVTHSSGLDACFLFYFYDMHIYRNLDYDHINFISMANDECALDEHGKVRKGQRALSRLTLILLQLNDSTYTGGMVRYPGSRESFTCHTVHVLDFDTDSVADGE
jgi:hypothetical protein